MLNVMIQKTSKIARKMTAILCTLAVLLSVCSLFSLIAMTVSAEDSESKANFTMTEPVYNVSGAALLAIDGCFTYDPEQYQRGAILIATKQADITIHIRQTGKRSIGAMRSRCLPVILANRFRISSQCRKSTHRAGTDHCAGAFFQG